jgi:hypothetical protein
MAAGCLTRLRHCARYDDESGLSLWENDAACMEWLDVAGGAALLYLSFGSLAAMVPARGIGVGITIRAGLASRTRVENWRSVRNCGCTGYTLYRAGLDWAGYGLRLVR